jgi:hypothetical protein
LCTRGLLLEAGCIKAEAPWRMCSPRIRAHLRLGLDEDDLSSELPNFLRGNSN